MESNKVYKLNEQINFEDQKRILIDTGDQENYIQKARKSAAIHQHYKDLLKQDYILYFHQKTISKFYKREYVGELFQRKDLIKFNHLFYTLDAPEGRKVNEEVPRKLLVIFTCMPNAKEYDSSLIPKRMFPKFFDGIEKSLVKNVYTMRIMDINVSHGSHYINTTNYPEYERDIKGAIESVQSQLDITTENIVLYGGSKGGTGAIYHGAALDLKTLAVDPIVNIGGKLEQNDRRFLKDNRKEDLVPTINDNLSKQNNFIKHVICSEKVPLYYNETSRIDEQNINKINMKDKMITSHPEVSRNTVPEQLMILNFLLGGHKQFEKD
ncbi:XcbB/CpsF family capsular polysaccharide biosynthesis protein [Staphylococcus succinus]|uniref:accessory Sec system protein Asp2 n=4 Tax=Staphylococcus TaxID=1279 RepID=UPI0023AF2DD2|nr:accessory Sec system protein Asp2 [Staphylococcus succinus]MEB8124945.1 XcbB/CpsF family capsular polysaccharide biosynthesis protein [Staphylococcus succinus]